MDTKEMKALQRILSKIGIENLIEILSNEVSSSDVNSLLLEVFRKRTNDTSAIELLKKYSTNRFVQPGDIDLIWLKQLEVDILKIAQNLSYTPIQISPVSVLGSCSVIATADQNKVISALRGTEVVADATNSLAIHICDSIKKRKLDNDPEFIRYSTSHRHIRAQKFDKPGLVPHFNIFCMVTSGKDKGSYSFEKQAILEHIEVYRDIFKEVFNKPITVKLNAAKGYTDSEGLVKRLNDYINEKFPDVKVFVDLNESDNLYYQGVQFTLTVNLNGQEINIGDGGFVDWSQKLLNHKKERMFISGVGLDVIYFVLKNDGI